MSTRTKWGFGSACLLAVGLFWGCGGELGSHSGGESHFLIQCDDTCANGLSCISGVCTKSCVVDEDDCDDLHASAECTDSLEPGAVAMCDVACNDDEDCESLGANYACEAGQCRGTTDLSSDSDGGSGGGTTNDTTSTSGGASGLSCTVLFQEYEDGAVFSDPLGCGSCVCSAGVVACDDTPCAPAVPVFECPTDFQSDAGVDVKGAFVQEDVLLLDVEYDGGCEIHDIGLCYDTSIVGDTETPGGPTGTLRLVHDSHGDSCDERESQSLHFDLQPYAEFVMAELEVTGAMIGTNFGFYALGELDCALAATAADELVDQAADQTLGFGCDADVDCVWAVTTLSCTNDCGRVVAVAAQDRFDTSVDHVQIGICDAYEANGCQARPVPECSPPPALGCVEGSCREL